MSENVVALRGGVLPGTPQPELIANLETFLEKARSGELQFMAYSTVGKDETIGTGWSGDCSLSASTTSLTWLYHKYMKAFLDA